MRLAFDDFLCSRDMAECMNYVKLAVSWSARSKGFLEV